MEELNKQPGTVKTSCLSNELSDFALQGGRDYISM